MPPSCDLRQYLDTIPAGSEDRVLFEEAVNVASVGALRGAYVLIWLSAAESLKRRFKELGSRDQTVRLICDKLNGMEVAHKAIDNALITEAKEYGLISDSEATRLKHVFEMRCLYAHPYEEAPAAVVLEAAASDVTEIVLSRALRYRKTYLKERIRLLTTEVTFLDDVRASVESYAKEVYTQLDQTLHAELLERLWKELKPLATDPAQALFFRRGVWFTKGFLTVAGESLLEQLKPTTALTTFPQVVSTVFSEPAIFRLLDSHAQDIVVGELLTSKTNTTERMQTLTQLGELGALTPRHKERLQEAINGMEIVEAIAVGVPMVHYFERIISDLKSHNWHIQNPAIEAIKNAGPEQVATLPPALQRELGNNVLQAADGSARAANNLLRAIAHYEDEAWPKDFIRGLIYECFINLSKNSIRFKDKWVEEALTSLRHLDPQDQRALIESLLEDLSKGVVEPTPFRSYFVGKLNEMKVQVGRAAQHKELPLADLISWLDKCPIPKHRFGYSEDE